MSLDPELLALEQELRALKPVEVDFPLAQRLTRALDDEYTALVGDRGLRVLQAAAPAPKVRTSRVAMAAKRWWPTAAAASIAFIGAWSLHPQNGKKSPTTAELAVPAAHAATGGGRVEWLGPTDSVKEFERRLAGVRVVPDTTNNLTRVESGEVRPAGYLGVAIQEITPALRQIFVDHGIQPPTRGAIITQVPEGTPAARAGLKWMDVITSVDGQEIVSAEQLVLNIQLKGAKAVVEIGIMREGKPLVLPTELGAAPML